MLFDRADRQDHQRVGPRALAQFIGAQLPPLDLVFLRHPLAPSSPVRLGVQVEIETIAAKAEARPQDKL
jgi:hypothetical protein